MSALHGLPSVGAALPPSPAPTALAGDVDRSGEIVDVLRDQARESARAARLRRAICPFVAADVDPESILACLLDELRRIGR